MTGPVEPATVPHKRGMPWIKRIKKSGLPLIAYRSGGKERTWSPTEWSHWEQFQALAAGFVDRGEPLPDPATIFEAAPNRAARRASAPHDADAFVVPQALPEPSEVTERMPRHTMRTWVGTEDDEGPFFEHTAKKVVSTKGGYFRLVRAETAIAKLEMNLVTPGEARRTALAWVVCEACRERARIAGRQDLLDAAHKKLLASDPPWDQAKADGGSTCVDDDGESTHFPAWRRGTMMTRLRRLNALWNAAITVGQGVPADDARCIGITSNPWQQVILPLFEDPPHDYDLSQALSHGQLELLSSAMPDWLRASIPVGAYGLLRLSELLGLERSMIDWPKEDSPHGYAELRIRKVYLESGEIRAKGKTALATAIGIPLTEIATEELRRHMRKYRSNPNPRLCDACRDGRSEHTGRPRSNPHRRCDFANDAPIWVDPRNGKRIPPWTYSRIFTEAVARPPLDADTLGFHATPKLLRATGATLYLDAGETIEFVCRIGRWTNPETLRNHYYRMRNARAASAVANLDAHRRAETGEEAPELTDSQRADCLSNRVQYLTAEIEVLRERLRDNALSDVVVAPVEWVLTAKFDNHELLAELISTCHTRMEILDKLGVARATKNYKRLEAKALILGLELPPKYGKRSA